MAGFRRANRERVNVFRVDDRYLFKHYFDGDDVFARLRRYYNSSQYRFEVPIEEFEEVQSFLREHGYGLITVDVAAEFVVVVRKYTTHPENIFKKSVIQRSVDSYNCFLMTDRVAVEEAVDETATRLTDTDLENPF